MTGTPSCRVAEIACSSESRADWVIDPASGEAMAMIPERFARRVAELLRIESCVREYLTYLLAITDMSLPSDEHTRLVESKVRDVIMPRFIGAQPTREDTTRWASRIEQAERLERTMDEFARNFPTSPKTVRVLEAIRCLASLRLVFMRLRFGTALNCASLAGLAIRDGFTISSVHELCR